MYALHIYLRIVLAHSVIGGQESKCVFTVEMHDCSEQFAQDATGIVTQP